MNRLMKKCFAGSAGAHLLLMVVLFVVPAFLTEKPKLDDSPILDFIPLKTVDALASGGGSPKGQLPQATPTPPVQPPQPPAVAPPPPERATDPEPPTEREKEQKPEKSDSLEANQKQKSRMPKVSTTLVRPKDTKKTGKQTPADDSREREANEARRQAAARIGQVASRIGSDMSASTTIDLKGPGGGGVPYANFLQAVKTRYTEAWVVPDSVTDDSATTAASVTIARDGTVIATRIVRSSGNSAVDQSVQATLARVRFAAPLPDNATENERTVTINFSVKAKRALG
jgi:TonB family protein